MAVRSLAGLVLGGACALGFALLVPGAASAKPYGTVSCFAANEGSRVVMTCHNEDDAAGYGHLQAVCSNGKVLWPVFGVAANSTQRFSDDCGEGAFPIASNAVGTAEWQKQERERIEQGQPPACPPGTPKGTMIPGAIC